MHITALCKVLCVHCALSNHNQVWCEDSDNMICKSEALFYLPSPCQCHLSRGRPGVLLFSKPYFLPHILSLWRICTEACKKQVRVVFLVISSCTFGEHTAVRRRGIRLELPRRYNTLRQGCSDLKTSEFCVKICRYLCNFGVTVAIFFHQK